ncbi:MAG: site-specific integrase [Pedobacter sp.]|nr:MAG: site-specific integrase [Pedobacter sp.]
MSQNYSLHFFLKAPKNYIVGPKQVYMRITVSGSVPKEASVGRKWKPEHWISNANRAKGTTEVARTLNSYLDAITREMEKIHTQMVKEMIEITAESLMSKFKGKEKKARFLIEVFADHNKKMEVSIGKIFKANTLKGYKSSIGHLTEYLMKVYRTKDIDLLKIDHGFVVGYEFFLRTERNISAISAAKYIKHFRKIINLSIAHGWIKQDPFTFYKNKAKPRDKEFLTKHELDDISEIILKSTRLNQVRDVFVFCCYTGLSYADIKKLKRSNIRKGDDGKLWIYTNREKNANVSNIPLLDTPENLMRKYIHNIECELSGSVFPVQSNQKMNSYLKEIASLCRIHKIVTFHIARHTFATTVTLSNNVPLESVAKMLGHKDLKTTQHYAKVLDKKVGEDMMELNRRLNVV